MANDSTYPRAGDRTPSARAQREEHWRRVLALQAQSGLSKADFCRREVTVKESALSWWARELKERDRPPRSPKARSKRKTPRDAFVPVRVIQVAPVDTASTLEVVTRSGLVIRLKPGFDPATLRSVVAALEGRPC